MENFSAIKHTPDRAHAQQNAHDHRRRNGVHADQDPDDYAGGNHHDDAPDHESQIGADQQYGQDQFGHTQTEESKSMLFRVDHGAKDGAVEHRTDKDWDEVEEPRHRLQLHHTRQVWRRRVASARGSGGFGENPDVRRRHDHDHCAKHGGLNQTPHQNRNRVTANYVKTCADRVSDR
jgi:hypothetical protein